jgi:hypothetical protein
LATPTHQKWISVEHSDLEVVMEGAVEMVAQMNATEGTLVDSKWKQERKNISIKDQDKG